MVSSRLVISGLSENSCHSLIPAIWLARKPELRARHGLIGGVFLAGYGVARIVSEIFREPDTFIGFFPFGTTWGQWLSVPMVIAGLFLIVRAKRA